jgi:hypothetical protein
MGFFMTVFNPFRGSFDPVLFPGPLTVKRRSDAGVYRG